MTDTLHKVYKGKLVAIACDHCNELAEFKTSNGEYLCSGHSFTFTANDDALEVYPL